MEDDMILPEGFEDTPTTEPTVETQEPVTEDVETESIVEDTKPTIDEGQTTPEPQKLKLKYNSQELEVTAEEAAVLAQKGMNYEKAVERARVEAAQQAKDSLIAEMGYTWNGQPITTETEYKQALAEQKLIEQYRDRDLPPEVIQELVESRRDREERQQERAARDANAKTQAEYADFLETFQMMNERQFTDKDTIPQEVWDAVNKGQPLKFAYLEHHNKELRNQLKIAKQNEANIKKAPIGSVTTGGGTRTEGSDAFLDGFNSH